MNTTSHTADVLLEPKAAEPARAAALPESMSPAVSVGFWVVAAWVFISFSRFFDSIAAGYKIPGIVYYVMVGVILISGAIPRALANRMTWWIVAFTVWMGITLPFSVWKSNSLQPSREAFQCLVTFVAVSGLTVSPRQCLRMLQTLGFAACVGAGLSFIFGNMETGRLEMAVGSFKDPNEYAMTLLMGLPLIALMARSSGAFLRFAGIAGSLLTFYVFLRAGSRGGMIALLVMGFVLFWGVSLGKKAIIVVAGGGALVLGLAILPGYLQQRYITFFSVDEAGPMSGEERAKLQGADVASTEGRLDLFYGGLRLTAKHPIFGVGPGNFPSAHWDESMARGIRTGWNVTHNTYLQLSSETGIPGLLLFVGFLFRAFTAVRRVIKNGAANGYPELARAGYHLWLSLTAVCAAAFFLSLGYSPYFYVLGAMALSLERAISQPSAVPAPVAHAAFTVTMPNTPVALDLPAPSAKKVMSGKEVRALMRKV